MAVLALLLCGPHSPAVCSWITREEAQLSMVEMTSTVTQDAGHVGPHRGLLYGSVFTGNIPLLLRTPVTWGYDPPLWP